MRVGHWVVAAAIGVLCACGRSEPQEAAEGVNAAKQPATPLAAPVAPTAPVTPAPSGPAEGSAAPPALATPPVPKPRSSLPEPKGPIDPKSVEAAGQVVQSYGALIEQKRWTEAKALWGDAGTATKFQADELSANSENHIEIGELGEPEGAAGSIYVTMPVTFYGQQANGRPYRKKRTVVLRRVNDVDGATAAQLRWHIERIDSQAP